MDEKELTGKRLRELRTKHKLTQQEIAEQIGTKQQRINEWENEKFKISKAYQKLLLLFFSGLEK